MMRVVAKLISTKYDWAGLHLDVKTSIFIFVVRQLQEEAKNKHLCIFISEPMVDNPLI